MIQNISKHVAALSADPSISASSSREADQQLADWDAYYRLLIAGKLAAYGGEYVAIHHGKVHANGPDLDEIRASLAQETNVDKEYLVISFVDACEGIVE